MLVVELSNVTKTYFSPWIPFDDPYVTLAQPGPGRQSTIVFDMLPHPFLNHVDCVV